MTIKYPELHARTIWDWGFLDDCFGGGISLGDIDGVVERNGYFLLIETKLPGVPLQTGQRMMFDEFAKLPKFTVVIVWGPPSKPESFRVWGRGDVQETNQIDFKRRVKRWFDHANKRGRDA